MTHIVAFTYPKLFLHCCGTPTTEDHSGTVYEPIENLYAG